jgi:hypothetical protein
MSGKVWGVARRAASTRNLFLSGVVALTLFVGLWSSRVNAHVGVELSADEASAISGGVCKDWVNVRCERPNQTTCTRRLCWRWLDATGAYDNNSPGVYCCLDSTTPCDAVVQVQNPCLSQ